MKGFNVSAWALEHKSFVGFLLAICAFAGLMAYESLGRDEDPPFTVKVMVVRAMWPGATAEETARQLTDRLEKSLESLQWLDYVSSFSRPGEATLQVVLKDATPPEAVPEQWYQIRKKIGDIKHTLPQGVQGPFFNDDFGDVYAVIYAFTSDGFTKRELRDFVELSRDELLRVDGVGRVDLIGAQDEVIYVDVSTRQWAGSELNADQIVEQIRAQNSVIGSGVIETGKERIAVRVSGALDGVESLENLNLRAGGRMVRLKDMAQVRRGYEDPPDRLFRFNGEEAIALGVAMRKGGNILALGESLDAAVARLRSNLPVGIDVHLVANQPHVVEESVGAFTKALFESIVIVLVVSFLSLGLRAGLVVAVCIPLVLAATFVLMDAYDIDLQRISLGALVIALGLLVDDAMIAVEMMVRKLEEGWDRFRAATFAYTSTAFPMLTGTLVTVAGFLPVGFAKSGAGEYCYTMFVVIAIALLASWIVAVVFVPYVGNAVLEEQKTGSHAHPPEGKGTRWFREKLVWALGRRRSVLIGTVVIFVLSVVAFGTLVRQEFFPSSDRPELLVSLKLRQSASIDAVRSEVRRLERVLLADPDVSFHSFHIGSGAPRFYLPLNVQLDNVNFAQAVVMTKGYEVRSQVRARLEKVLDEEFDAVLARVEPLQFGPPVDWPLQYRVGGPDVATVRSIAEQLAQVIQANPGARLVNYDWHDLSRSVLLDVDQDKARRLGLSSEQLAQQLSQVLSGRLITQVRDDIYLIDVRGRAAEEDRKDLQALRDLDIGSASGGSIPLAQIATFSYGLEEPVIWRKQRQPTITLQADVSPGTDVARTVEEIAPAVEKLRGTLPVGYRIEVAGMLGESAKGSSSIVAVIPAMFVVMLFVLMVQLQSVQKLTLVMLTAPLGLIGVTLALLIFDKPFGFVAMLGTFALIGMIIRNSVVLVAQIQDNETEGMGLYQAIVEATVHRLRPILLTAMAAILGLVPIAGEVFWGPMAYAMMGGLLVATVLTLFVLPALYATWYRVPSPRAGHAPA
jgi:multidrug efflux pump subunit AcrB